MTDHDEATSTGLDPPTERSSLRVAGPILLPVVLMAAAGAYLGTRTVDDGGRAYLDALLDGLIFAAAPVVGAVVLFVVYRLVRALFRARR